MTAICHHPEDELLAAFSAASLPLTQALCVSVHLENCHECKARLSSLESLGGEMLQALEPSKADEGLKTQVLARIKTLEAQPDRPEAFPQERAPDINPAGSALKIPKALRQFVENSYEDLSWQRVSPSIRSAELCWEKNTKVELLRIKAGGSASMHTHMGDEYTVILEGSFSDEDGVYKKGDFLSRNEQHKHKPVATSDGECICLAVTEGPVQFTGFFSRWLNPLIRRSYRDAGAR